MVNIYLDKHVSSTLCSSKMLFYLSYYCRYLEVVRYFMISKDNIRKGEKSEIKDE